jgi:hypothetical protein
MNAVRRAPGEIAALKLDLWSEDGAPSVAVDRSGGIVIEQDGRAQLSEYEIPSHKASQELGENNPDRDARSTR